jgi:hypothetical protein
VAMTNTTWKWDFDRLFTHLRKLPWR